MPLDSSLDESAIEMLRSLGSPEDPNDFLREVIDIFLVDSPQRLDEMEAAFQAGDAPHFRRVAHSLKGSAANAGAGALRDMAAKLEAWARDHGIMGLEPPMPEMRAEFDRTREALLKLAAPAGPAA
jgi:HPt (histidine-containing phosphotransfer) domain-containing protein